MKTLLALVVELTGILQANKKYKTEFYVSASDVMHAKSNSIGVYFSTDSFFVSSAFLGLIDVVPQTSQDKESSEFVFGVISINTLLLFLKIKIRGIFTKN